MEKNENIKKNSKNLLIVLIVVLISCSIIGVGVILAVKEANNSEKTEEKQEVENNDKTIEKNNSNQESNNINENEQDELTFTINGTNYGTISEKDIKKVTIIITKKYSLDPEYDVEKELKDLNKLKEIIDLINTSSLEDATNLEVGYEFSSSTLNIVYTKNGEEKTIQILGDYGLISGEGKNWINTLNTFRDKLDTKIRNTYYEI